MSTRTLDSSDIPSLLTHMGDLPKGRAVYACACGWLGQKIRREVRVGRVRSCGCLRRRLVGLRSKTHGHSLQRHHSRTYSVWAAMIARCTNANGTHWHSYGGRGIAVCKRWRKFANFLADMGERPTRSSIERKNNNKGYSPDNCRWATTAEQSRNTQRTVWLEYAGKKWPMVDLAAHAGIPYKTFMCRVRLYGWSVERAVKTPVRSPS